MRRQKFIPGAIAVAFFAVACATQPPGAPSTAPPPRNAVDDIAINPDNLRRMRPNFPAGYEVENLVGPASPASLWGLKTGWVADPPQCGALAQPADAAAPTQGLSGSGPGGIVHTVVANSPATPAPDVLIACARWTITSGNTTAMVDLVDAPRIDRVTTLATATATRTVVEGGTETDSSAHTATAYLGDHVVFVTVVTDPGSPVPQLSPSFAGEFLAQTVAALRR